MRTGITGVIGGPHGFLPPRSDRSDEFQKLWDVTQYKFDPVTLKINSVPDSPTD